MNVSLHPEMAKFVRQQVRSGRFQTPDDVINGALGMLRSQQESMGRDELAELRALVAVGIGQADRGEVEDWDVNDLRAEGQRLLNEAKRKPKPAPRKKAV